MEALPVANLLLRRGGAVALARRRIFIRLSRGRRHHKNTLAGWHDGPYGGSIFDWGELMLMTREEVQILVEFAHVHQRRKEHEDEQSWLLDWLDLVLFVGSDIEGENARN
jgi:hypothetical protein